MPAYDRFHTAVRNALKNDGWTITDDPLTLKYEGQELFVDLAADKVLSAEKGNRKIAVEIKTFAGRSEMADLHQAVGQYMIYTMVLSEVEPDRELYLAITEAVYQDVFRNAIGALALKTSLHHVFTFDPEQERIIRWLP
jgi:hypothetical protein